MGSTLRDVAVKAGVSTCTVSHVINNSARVRPETRKRVEQAVKELGYHPNLLARSLRRSQSKILGLVLADLMNPFFTQIARAVQDEAARALFQIIVCNTDEDVGKEGDAILALFGMRVDGVILAPSKGNHRYLARYAASDFPIVAINRRIEDPPLPYVIADNENGAHDGIQHLLARGHRRIAVITGLKGTSTTKDRLRGFRRALSAQGISIDPQLIRHGRLDVESGYAATRALMSLSKPPTAILAFNNNMTEGALLALRDLGIRCPEDVALIGYDDFRSAAALDPPITVVAQPTAQMGRQAVRMLLDLLAKKRLRSTRVVLPTAFIHRSSCGCASNARKR